MFSIYSKNVQIAQFHTKSPFYKFYLWQVKFPDVLISPMSISIPSQFLFEDYYNKKLFLLRSYDNLKYTFIKLSYFIEVI